MKRRMVRSLVTDRAVDLRSDEGDAHIVSTLLRAPKGSILGLVFPQIGCSGSPFPRTGTSRSLFVPSVIRDDSSDYRRLSAWEKSHGFSR